MNVFITGATGLIGRALTLRLRRDGYGVTALVRDEARSRDLLGDGVSMISAGASETELRSCLAGHDAVVNLAGEPLIGRWTEGRRRKIEASRVSLTTRLVEAMVEVRTPRVLISASAVGYYGDRGDEMLTESSGPGSGFLAELCARWEEAAVRAESADVRVVRLRTGIVLGRDGGALPKLLGPFRLGLGGPIGSGRQYMPWIHLDDHIEMVAAALADSRYNGALNLTAPEPVRNREFAQTLGAVLRRPAFMPVPSFMLKAVLGEASSVLLSGQRAVPQEAMRLGFRFSFPTLESALTEITGRRVASMAIHPSGT
jgi:uncharacterized protein (TIGR01777 family)